MLKKKLYLAGYGTSPLPIKGAPDTEPNPPRFKWEQENILINRIVHSRDKIKKKLKKELLM